ncbi:GreA/GreB family elongation factor [Psychroserpens mesophilus]|uniref:GreA/GreB family elongation factor n=1 Tax=Psychroserpens mesophilus TaxID=325473 RepID=UPI00058B3E77|nr:GreA/GreB family elongation factor [Psychroserpens mesophilus]
MSTLKSKLFDICLTHVNKRISSYKDEIETIKESIDSNDKSTDEDDDSGNGKLMNDLEKNAQYLSDAHKMLDIIKLINPKTTHQNVVLGSLVKTSSANFYIAVSIGKVDVDDEPYFIISKSSPIGQLLLNKVVGDEIAFNENRYKILDIK